MPCVKELQGLFLVETYTRARKHAYRVLEDSSRRVDACPEILSRSSSYYEILLELLLLLHTGTGPSIVGDEGSTVVSAMVGIVPGQSTRSSYEAYLPSILQHMQCMVHKLSVDCHNKSKSNNNARRRSRSNANATQQDDYRMIPFAGDSTHAAAAGSYVLSPQRSHDCSEGGDASREQLRVVVGGRGEGGVGGGLLDLEVLQKFNLHRCCCCLSVSTSDKGAERVKDHLLSSVIDYSITNIDHLPVHDLLIYRHRSIYYKLITYPPI